MNRLEYRACVRVLLLVGAIAIAASAGAEAPKEKAKQNSNALIIAHRKKLKLSASSSYPNFRLDRLIDGKAETSWFSANNDSVAQGGTPYVEITFPEDVKVNRVTVLGNREPDHLEGYSVLSGRIEFRDKEGKKLWTAKAKGAGDKFDFDFRPKEAVEKVRSIRFTSLEDQGDQNGSGDVALAEVLIE
jgi:hypothetical protein